MHESRQQPDDAESSVERLIAEFLEAERRGEPIDRDEFLLTHPEYAEALEAFFADREMFRQLADSVYPGAPSQNRATAGTDSPTLHLAASPVSPTPVPGSLRYFGNYELEEEIARGGMGVVYKARQVTLDRSVAVKMILAGQLATSDDVRRFQAEAQAAANLQHPNIVAIHEVGEHGGQHYFSMDFIAGRSLAELVRESPLPALRAARYVRIVAEAIHVAHQQGIVHRDLKPSNVLVDAHDEPHVTDFGLAMRTSVDSGLTGTGQVLGTPSYMPPEQATGQRDKMGPASDVYSLGAILYELVVGRPPFRAETPVDTVLQVMHDDPVSPRLLNGNVSRDLETIILKCLAKEPARRYASAQALAGDLAAVVEGRPIAARRPGPAEQAVRWLARQKRGVALSIGAVAATLLVSAVGMAIWLAWQRSQIGTLSIDTSVTALVADVLDENDRSVLPRVGVPTEEPVPLPAGDYRLRVSGRGALSETYRVSVRPGAASSFSTDLAERPMGKPLELQGRYEFFPAGDRTDIIATSPLGIARRRGGTNELLWECTLGPQPPAALGGLAWDWTTAGFRAGGDDLVDRVAFLVAPAFDINGDGENDIIWALQHRAAVIAISGKDGAIVWARLVRPFAEPATPVATPLPDGARPDSAAATQRKLPAANEEGHTIVGPPVVRDVDRDGTPDLVVTAAVMVRQQDSHTAERFVAAVSGKTGDTLWRRELPRAWFDAIGNANVPLAFRWFYTGSIGGYSSSGGSSGTRGGSHMWSYHETSTYDYSGTYQMRPGPAQLVDVDGKPCLAVLAGARLAVLSADTGEEEGLTIDLKTSPTRPVQFADLDADGSTDALVVDEPGQGQTRLRAVSLSARKEMWRHTIEANWRAYIPFADPPANWPVFENLDVAGDARPEVIVPNGQPYFRNSMQQPAVGMQVLDGATGKSRWHKTWTSSQTQVNRFAVGPDVDGDGQREVFAATLVQRNLTPRESTHLYVDCLSGRDGRKLWWSAQPLKHSLMSGSDQRIGPLLWWSAGADGLPMLVVPYRMAMEDKPTLFVLAVSSGRLSHLGPNVANPRLADVDGDGVSDMATLSSTMAGSSHRGGDLTVLRGSATEIWLAVGNEWRAGSDFDGDGTADILAGGRYASPAAISARSGKALWRSKVKSWNDVVLAPGGKLGDVDRDGTPDLLLVQRPDNNQWEREPLVRAVSGKTGELIWNGQERTKWCVDMQLAQCVDLAGDGNTQILLVSTSDPGKSESPNPGFEFRLDVVSGRSGQTRWNKLLTSRRNMWQNVAWQAPEGWSGGSGSNWWAEGTEELVGPSCLQLALARVNADTVDDILIGGRVKEVGAELLALDGVRGDVLWRLPLGERQNDFYVERNLPVPVAAEMSDGRKQILIQDYEGPPHPNQEGPTAAATKNCVVHGLDPATGKIEWTWRETVAANSGRVDDERNYVLHRPRPLPIRLGRGGASAGVCVWTWGCAKSILVTRYNNSSWVESKETPGQIVVLGARGQVLRRLLVDPPEAWRTETRSLSFRVWNLDVDGDGADELLYATSGKLVAMRAEAGGPVWTWTLPRGFGDIVEIDRSAKGGAVILASSGDALHALAAATGKVLWHSDVPNTLAPGMTPPQMLARGDLRVPPWLLYAQGSQTQVCRLAHAELTDAERRGAVVAEPPRAAASDDPRLVRRLPWAPMADFPIHNWPYWLASFLMVALPGLWIWKIVRQGSFSMRELMVAPLVASIAVVAAKYSMSPDRPFWVGLNDVFSRGFGAVLIVAFLCPLVLWTVNRRWRPLRLMLAGCLLLVVIQAGVMLWNDRAEVGAGESYVLDGWYGILIYMAMPLGLIVVVVAVLGAIIRFARRLWQAWRPARLAPESA